MRPSPPEGEGLLKYNLIFSIETKQLLYFLIPVEQPYSQFTIITDIFF